MILWIAMMMVAAQGSASVKAEWVKQVSSAGGLPKALCRSPVTFRSCYELSESQCLEKAGAAAQSCAKSIDKDIPESMDTKIAGSIADRIGKCMESKFAADWKDRKVISPECD